MLTGANATTVTQACLARWQARQLATKRMVDEAEALGADAVLNIRYASASIMQGAAEITVYGTAVKYRG